MRGAMDVAFSPCFSRKHSSKAMACALESKVTVNLSAVASRIPVTLNERSNLMALKSAAAVAAFL